jgi:ferric-dicitrate binding protein FerR (iron transport regulator)
MTDDYLWDKSGPPDPEVQRLEQVLGVLSPRKPFLVPPQPARAPARLWFLVIAFAAAAAAVVAMIMIWLPRRSRAPECFVVRVEGEPTIGSKNLGGRAKLREGEWLETDTRSRAKVSIGRIVTVDVEPNTSLQLVRVHPSEDRISLRRGKMHATIFAPPRLFFVDTPSAVTIDLGCAYTLEVDGEGNTRVEVTHGMVSIVLDGRESFIPQGAVCVARKGIGPGTPYYRDAAPALVSALEQFDRNSDPKALQAVLTEANAHDAFTLWHLIGRTSGPARLSLVSKLAALAPPPAGVSAAKAEQGDPETLRVWFEDICPQAHRLR